MDRRRALYCYTLIVQYKPVSTHSKLTFSILKHSKRRETKKSLMCKSQLLLEITNTVFHSKTRLSMRFTVTNWVCASTNYYFKLHNCDDLKLSTYFGVFCDGKSDMCATDIQLHICNNPSQNHIFFRVLLWKIQFVQLSILT